MVWCIDVKVETVLRHGDWRQGQLQQLKNLHIQWADVLQTPGDQTWQTVSLGTWGAQKQTLREYASKYHRHFLPEVFLTHNQSLSSCPSRSDYGLWRSWDGAQMSSYISRLLGGLDTPPPEGGKSRPLVEGIGICHFSLQSTSSGTGQLCHTGIPEWLEASFP